MSRSVLIAVVLLITSLTISAAVAAPVVGWRTDGTGRYANATPPPTWGPTTNVIWSTALPSWSNATPTLVGDRIFVCSEPATLVCLSAQDGSILWQKTNDFASVAKPEEVEGLSADQKQGNVLRGQMGQAQGALRKLKTDAQDKPDDADLKARIAETEKQISDLRTQIEAYDAKWYSLPNVHPTNGFASPTPVSDGQHVWVQFNTSLVACYDLEGNRVWHKVLAKSPISWGPSASPVLVGDVLLCHSRDMYGLDKNTGEIKWQTPMTEAWGTALPTKVGDTDVAVTPAGDVVRVSDGVLVGRGLAKCTFCAPIIEGDVAYFIENFGKAIRLKEINAENKLVTEELWTTKPKAERYYASPVLVDGLIYCCMQYGVFSCIDAATGAVVYEKDLGLGKGTVYPSLAAAGGNIYVSSDNGNTVVVKPGREFAEVGRMSLEPFRASPVFVGNRVYIRGLTKLWCLGTP